LGGHSNQLPWKNKKKIVGGGTAHHRLCNNASMEIGGRRGDYKTLIAKMGPLGGASITKAENRVN